MRASACLKNVDFSHNAASLKMDEADCFFFVAVVVVTPPPYFASTYSACSKEFFSTPASKPSQLQLLGFVKAAA